MKNIGFWTIVFIISSVGHAFSEIKLKYVYDNIFNSCNKSRDANISKEIMLKYCTCSARKTVKEFGLLELFLFEKKIEDMTESERVQVALANKKMAKIMTSCVTEAFN